MGGHSKASSILDGVAISVLTVHVQTLEITTGNHNAVTPLSKGFASLRAVFTYVIHAWYEERRFRQVMAKGTSSTGTVMPWRALCHGYAYDALCETGKPERV